MSDEVQDLVRRLLDPDPENRLTIQDVLRHAFLASVANPASTQQAEPVIVENQEVEYKADPLAGTLNNLLGFVTLDPSDPDPKYEAK